MADVAAPRPAFGADGLVTAVAQDATTGEVLMVAHMDADAWEATLRDGLATFWSRSRGRLWRKGETSGHTLAVRRIRLDCDADAVLLAVDPAGPACHTGAPSCFFTEVAVARRGDPA
ncbi:MAG TPA: phosphoribosyl-AMP cyclohydrolase [Candidatus Dormibacteraeota bacterium]|nr:phosphoribosyl-AMP cyclohydrolase [Candidatus Dormibacteraeota bacterium]